jgi:lipopolysaccharide heptosyltransferase I
MRIVLIRLSALGDIVHTWPLAVALHAERPEAHLTWIVEQPLATLVEGHPAVDTVLTVATGQWRKRPFSARTRAEIAAFKSRVHELQPDLSIDAQGTLKSGLVTRWCKASRRVGLARPWRREVVAGLAYTETLPGSSSHRHVVATNLELVRSVGGEAPVVPSQPDGRWLLERARPHFTGSWGTGYAVILPGAGQPEKILSAAILADTARYLASQGMHVVTAWGPSERERAEEIIELGGAGVHLAPPTNLIELTALLGSAAVVVGGDTGPVHLAASLGVPTLAVFLTTDPERNGPAGARVAVVSGAAPGRGPRGSATTGRARTISASEICTAIEQLLGSHE